MLFRNAVDVARIGCLTGDLASLRAEFLVSHRIARRRPLARRLPKGRVGAELGVFTGLFSSVLLTETQASKIYFVDPWWTAYGETFPSWGRYTVQGTLGTRTAHELARRRIRKFAGSTETDLRVMGSDAFFESIPEAHLDWIYLDSSHAYEGTVRELRWLTTRMKPGGIVAGDDWHDDESAGHGGVARAVREAIERGEFDMIGTFDALQWAVRKT